MFSKAAVVPGMAVAPPCAIPESVDFGGIAIKAGERGRGVVCLTRRGLHGRRVQAWGFQGLRGRGAAQARAGGLGASVLGPALPAPAAGVRWRRFDRTDAPSPLAPALAPPQAASSSPGGPEQAAPAPGPAGVRAPRVSRSKRGVVPS